MPGQPPAQAIEVRNVWKIFGERAAEAMEALRVRAGDRAEVQKRFDCVVAVADAEFSVSQGEIFCVMGLSGSGKSTLVRHVNRLLEPTAGQILIEGRDVMALNEAELRELRNRLVTMVFQNFGLMPHRTVRDNVCLPLEIRGVGKARRWSEAERVLGLVKLQGWEDRFAHELSGGMQQRVGLARALAADPSILLLDEPFSALDPLIRRQLQDEFMELSASLRKTTIFITHDLDEAIRIGDRIAIMKDGRLVQVGTPEEIVLNPIDGYVADFVAGISKLDLVHAHSIMTPIAQYRPEDAAALQLVQSAPGNATLNALIDRAADGQDAIPIAGEDDVIVGVVDRASLMRAIQDSRGWRGASA